jgi:diguanylate cyclase (GGDEF)-like protein/PAS domain S-box-containing protein
MPELSPSHAAVRSGPLLLPRARSHVAASAGAPPVPPPVAVPTSLSSALLSWADQDDACLVLLEAVDDREPCVRWVSRQGAQLLGYASEELLEERLSRLLRSPFASSLPPGISDQPLVDRRRTLRRSLRIQRRDGSPLLVTFTSVPVPDGPRQQWIVRLVHELDVAQAADALRASHERFRALADHAPIGIFSSDSGLRLAYVNDTFSELYGERAEQLTGTGWLDFIEPDDREAVVEAVTGVLQGAGQELPLRVLRRDGERRSVLARLVPVRSSGRDSGFVGTFEDVTERQEWEASLAYQAAHDPLTSLLNRRRLLELLGEALLGARSPSSPRGVALLFLDLDDFKHVNDSLGHQAGDRLLVEVARRLQDAVRDGDVVSRFGGDEFAVLCHGIEAGSAAGEMARRVLQAVTGPLHLGGTTVSVSGSIGVVLGGPEHGGPEDVLRDADVAMYQAKAAGKDCWALFDEQARRQAQQRLDLARDLRTALAEGQLSVQYQPILRLGPSRQGEPALASVEALVRWIHPNLGLVPPSEFIELAEQAGLISRLGLQVLQAACSQMVRWQQRLGARAPQSVSVNVSALQLRQPGFPDVVAEVLEETGLQGTALCLELTETVVMDDPVAAAQMFRRLQVLGVRLSMDDFGTGYSSLSLLRQLPFDQIKIDRSLLPDLGRHGHDPVVAAVVAMGQALGMAVVAEGVETPEQMAELRRLGCPLGQGFLFGPPLTPLALEAWVLQAAAGQVPTT